MTPKVGRLLMAVVAWPAGLLCAILVALLLPFVGPACTDGPCALESAAAWEKALLLVVAFGPGMTATWAWWSQRRAS